MAGGKLTPRQKMINMMYLVLTALLALNVSATILESFQTIANSLRKSAEHTGHRNEELVKRIKEAVQEMENKRQIEDHHRQIPPATDEVTGKTNEVIHMLEETIEKLSTPPISEVLDEGGVKRIQNLGETEKNYVYMMKSKGLDTDHNGRGAGRAYEVREALTKYVDWANEQYKKYYDIKPKPSKPLEKNPFDYLCIDPKDDPRIPKGSDHARFSWEYFTFHDTPVISNIAILEKLKTDINAIEAELLEVLKSKLVSVPPFTIDKLVAVDAPKSTVVVAGLPFETSLYVTAVSKKLKPTFSSPSGKVTPDKEGNTATLKINPQANFKGSEAKQSYTASVSVKNTDGKVENLQIKGTFTVVKPVIQVSGSKVLRLYSGCANPLTFECPQLEVPGIYFPKIEVPPAEGDVQQHPTKKKDARVVPKNGNKKCHITISNVLNGTATKIETLEYSVVPPPLPDIGLQVNNKEWNGSERISSRATLSVYVRPEKNFGEALPMEARYQINQMTVKKKAGLGAPKTIKTYENGPIPRDAADKTGIKIPLGAVWNDGGPMTGGIILTINQVSRVNFRNDKFNITDEYKSERDRMLVGFVEDN